MSIITFIKRLFASDPSPVSGGGKPRHKHVLNHDARVEAARKYAAEGKTAAETAVLMGVHIASAYAYMRQGKFRFRRPSRAGIRLVRKDQTNVA